MNTVCFYQIKQNQLHCQCFYAQKKMLKETIQQHQAKLMKSNYFYIMTRGFSYKEAVKLIVKSKFNKIIDRIPDKNLKDEIINEIDKRLD